MSKPVVGLSVSFHDFGDYLGVGFERPIARAGGIPLILSRAEGTLDEQLSVIDAVVIAGGRDIDPRRYGQDRHELTGPLDPLRDEFELELVAQALARGLPLLGMCHGSQILNVALGGTLVQDLSLVGAWREHPTDPGWQRWKAVEQASLRDERTVPQHPRHPLRIVPGSRLHAALGAAEIEVSSFHHQAIDRLGDGLAATGLAPDGVVEVVELEDPERYALGTQFELQEEWRIDVRFLELFRQFLTAGAGVAGA